jgi:hypothetical protein
MLYGTNRATYGCPVLLFVSQPYLAKFPPPVLVAPNAVNAKTNPPRTGASQATTGHGFAM